MAYWEPLYAGFLQAYDMRWSLGNAAVFGHNIDHVRFDGLPAVRAYTSVRQTKPVRRYAEGNRFRGRRPRADACKVV